MAEMLILKIDLRSCCIRIGSCCLQILSQRGNAEHTAAVRQKCAGIGKLCSRVEHHHAIFNVVQTFNQFSALVFLRITA